MKKMKNPEQIGCISIVRLRRRPRRSAMALVLTLMTLIVLTAIVVHFQQEAGLYLRSSSYQAERLQCRYAAESGLVIAGNIVRGMLYNPESPINLSQRTGGASLPDMSQIDDPNFSLEVLEEQLKEFFVVHTEALSIGEAEVEIEVQDENAKWPVLWLLRSPYRSRSAQREFSDFAESMGIKSTDAYRAYTYIMKIGHQLDRNLPQAERQVVVDDRRVSGNSRYQNVRRFRSFQRQMLDEKQRRETMGEFAQRWQRTLVDTEELAPLREPLPDRGYAFNDLVGIWGNNLVNINTASAEVLFTAFKPVGLTKAGAESIVEYRQTTPFRQPTDLAQVGGLQKEVVERMRDLCVVRSDSFSVHVTARLGRTTYHLIGSVYDFKGRVKFLSLVTDDA